jgi:hypothetical protein
MTIFGFGIREPSGKFCGFSKYRNDLRYEIYWDEFNRAMDDNIFKAIAYYFRGENENEALQKASHSIRYILKTNNAFVWKKQERDLLCFGAENLDEAIKNKKQFEQSLEDRFKLFGKDLKFYSTSDPEMVLENANVRW